MKKIKINELKYDFSKYGSLFIEAPIGSGGQIFVNQFVSQLLFIKNVNIKILDPDIFFDNLITYNIPNVEYYHDFNQVNTFELKKHLIKLFYQKCLKRASLVKEYDYKNVKDYNKQFNIKINPEFLIINVIDIQDIEIIKQIKFIIKHSKYSNMFIICIGSFDIEDINNYDNSKDYSYIKLSNTIKSYGSFTNNKYKINKHFNISYLDEYAIKSIVDEKNKIK